MRVSMEWLSDYVDIIVDQDELAARLTDTGTAVDGMETIGVELEEFTVGRIMQVKSHPSADRLSLCLVDVGDTTLDIICGAPNVFLDAKVPVALPGSRLPDGTAIKETSIRGVTSRGMILSEKELGISEEAEGIMILDKETEVGIDLARALGMPDRVLILDITPNRPDCLSMVGVAREVAAITGEKARKPDFDIKEGGGSASQAVRVEIMDPDLCSRYVARIIDNLKIDKSPWWLRRRLQSAGVRPINSVVDVTNYVMIELGQPLHAFDYKRVRDGHIIVRRAMDGEVLTTLDGVARELSSDDLVICDPGGSVALAGVMGGEHTEVSDETSRVLLESAHFDPANIMRTSRTLDISSEASYRFERGVDPNGCVYAAGRAAFLMQELAGGEVLEGEVDSRGRVIEPASLSLRVKRTGKLIGIPLALDKAKELLNSIELEAKRDETETGDEILLVEVPTFRPDLEREIDLVEEVSRLYGYGRVPATLPQSSSNVGYLNREQKMRRRLAKVMTGLGLHEVITQAFISPAWLDILDPGRERLPEEVFRLRNPISEEASIMRPSLLPGLLEAVRFNVNRRVMDLSFYEIGKVFHYIEGEKLPRETLKLGCAAVGHWIPKQWAQGEEEVDFFTAKGILEILASWLQISVWSLRNREFPFLHPAQSCSVLLEGSEVGYVGLVHPRVAGETDIPENTVLIEMDVERLMGATRGIMTYKDIPRFPSIQLDIAVVVKEEVTCDEVELTIKEAGGELLHEVRLFDLYRGEQIGDGEKSLAYNLTFYDLERTLRDEEARSACEDVVKALAGKLGARLR